MLRSSNFLRNSIIHFHMILYLETYFPRATVSLVCRFQTYHRYMFKFISMQFVKGDEIVRPCDRHSIETKDP